MTGLTQPRSQTVARRFEATMRYTIGRLTKDDSGYYGGCVLLCQAVAPDLVCETILVNQGSQKIFEELMSLVPPGASEWIPPDPLWAEIETVAEFDAIPGPSFTRRALSGSLLPTTVPTRPPKDAK